MFDDIRNEINLILDYCDDASDANWATVIQKIKFTCELAKFDLEELEYQNSNN